MSGFALLWGKILESSLWVTESKETRLVWITLLAMKDAEGVIQASVVGLADRAKVKESECREALRVLLSPDPGDTSKVDGGRRIREVPGGWQIVNNEAYRFSTEARRAIWREQKAAQRAAEWIGKEKLAEMNAAERAAYEAGRARGYGKRRKPIGTRSAGNNGEIAGAREALAQGMAEAASVKADESRGTLPEAAPAAAAPEITPEAAAAIAAREKLRPAPVPIPGPVGAPAGSPLGMGWAEQEVEVKRPGAPVAVPSPAAPAPVKPSGPVDVRLAIHQPGKAAGQG